MVAEPTLFLSSDEEIQVRVHINRRGLKVYCVLDFIRMLSNKPMLPSEAELYWLGALCSPKLWNEHAIMDQYPVRFPGPYAPRLICLVAGGLLLLFLHMEQNGVVRDQYIEEVKQRLEILAEGGGAEYVRDHDDGEVDEMMAAKDAAVAKGEGLDGPPEDWPFFFDKAGDAPNPAAAAQLQKVIASISEKQAAVEEREKEGGNDGRAMVKKQKNKKTAFTLKDLMGEMQIEVDRAFMPAFGKAVSARFKEMCPGSETFTRKRFTYFYEEDKECLERLVQEEHMKYLMRKVDREFAQV